MAGNASNKGVVFLIAVMGGFIAGMIYLASNHGEKLREKKQTRQAIADNKTANFPLQLLSTEGREAIGIARDTLTGCEYFVTREGNITPRLASNGMPVCNERLAK